MNRAQETLVRFYPHPSLSRILDSAERHVVMQGIDDPIYRDLFEKLGDATTDDEALGHLNGAITLVDDEMRHRHELTDCERLNWLAICYGGLRVAAARLAGVSHPYPISPPWGLR